MPLVTENFSDIITFTRNSTGTYFNSSGVLTSASNNVPRRDYNPITLEARGLLIEEQRTNNLVQSESFRGQTLTVTITGGTFQNGETVTATGGGAGIYVASESTATSFVIYNYTSSPTSFTGTLTGGTSGATATISSNATAWSMGANAAIVLPPNSQSAPDGTTSAEVFGPTTVGTLSRTMFQEFATTTQGAWTFSIFVKKGTLSNNLVALRVRENTGTHAFRANFNLSTLAVPTVSIDGGSWTAGTATVTPCQNGWVRLSVTGTVNTAVTFYRTEIWIGGYQGVPETIGTIYVWGAQLEAGAFPTSYIPTTTMALTRNPDQASVNTLSPWFNATEGTLFAEAQHYAPSAAVQQWQAQLASGTGDYYGIYKESSPDNITTRVRSGGANQAFAYTTGAVSANTTYKTALGYAVNDVASCTNGGTVFVDTPPAALPLSITALGLGQPTYTTAVMLNGYLRRITYYPRRLSNTDLQTITA